MNAPPSSPHTVERVLTVRLDALTKQIELGFNEISRRLDVIDDKHGRLETRVRSLEASAERSATKIATVFAVYTMCAGAAVALFFGR